MKGRCAFCWAIKEVEEYIDIPSEPFDRTANVCDECAIEYGLKSENPAIEVEFDVPASIEAERQEAFCN